MTELLVRGDQVNCGLRIGIVGRDGVDQCAQGLLHAIKLRLQDVVHGCSTLYSANKLDKLDKGPGAKNTTSD